MSKETHTANLAVRPTEARIHPRLQLQRLRVAFVGIVFGAKRMPDRWYGLTERNRTVSFPFEREREFIHEAIRQGATTEMQILTWRLTQLADDLAQFPNAPTLSDLCYIRLMAEQAEALQAQARAHGIPTQANREAALRETREAITVLQMECALLEQDADESSSGARA